MLQQRAERVHGNRLGRGPRASARHDEHHVEHAEGIEPSKQGRHEQRRLEQGQRDVDELLPRSGAIDVGRFVQRSIDVLQAGKQQQRDKRGGLPDVGEHQRHPRGEFVGEPGWRCDADVCQCRRGESPRRLEDEPPDERGDHGRNRPRENHNGADEPAASDNPIEHECEHQTRAELEGDSDEREQRRASEGAPEARVARHFHIVAPADERPAQPGHTQVIEMQ
jgi:hypothetical protein